MKDEEKNIPRMQSNSISFLDPAKIRKQAEQKAKDMYRPNLDIMTREEIRQLFHKMQIKQMQTERENDLLRSELGQKNDILTGISDGVWSLTWPDLEIVYLNPATEEIYGCPLQDFYENPNLWQEATHPEDRHTTRQAFEKLQEKGTAKRECRIIKPDGSIAWITDKSKLVYDENNNPVRVEGVCRDITERKRAEAALQQSEKKHRTIINTTIDGFWQSDMQGRLLDVNEAYCRLTGYSSEELLNMSITDIEAIEKIEEIAKRIKKIKQTGSDRFETRHRRKDGVTVDVEVSVNYFATDGGRMFVFVRDITERKQAEEALRRQHVMLARTEAMAHVGSWEWEAEGDKVTWSEELFRILGLEPMAEAPPFAEHQAFYIPEDRARLVRAVKECLQNGVPYNLGVRVTRSDGQLRHCVVQGIPEHGADGSVHRLYGSLHDINEIRRVEERLKESEEKYRRIADNVTDVVWMTDLEMNPIYISPSVERVFGVTPEEYLKLPISKTYPPASLEKFQERLAEEFKNEQDPKADKNRIFKLEVERYYVNGTICWDAISAKFIRDEQMNPIAIQGVSRDITERKQAEKEQERLQVQLSQAQKMESVGRLAGGVAHDFNNKLTIINGYTELAMETIDPSDPLYETIQEIHTAGKKSADIVRQLLAFARKQTISPVMLYLNDTISGMLKMLQRLIGENIDLAWHPGDNLWRVKMDPSQVDQLMANLAVNARDAISDVGKLSIETKNTIVDKDYCKSNPEAIAGQYVMLAVSDDGCGMEKEVQDLLFEPFFTTKEIGKGTGLGLPTVYGIVKQNNGFINVYSEPGEGTTFKLYFPSCETEKSSVHSAKEYSEQIPAGTETILVVEDEKTILQMARQMLERLGYTVETAGTPAEALHISKEYDATIHLLIADVIMPDMNGRDLSVRLSKSHPDLKTLYMSGYTANVIAHHGVIDEGVQFIQKPFSLRDLAVKVREVLEQE